jgi:hypothetical protein
VPVFKNLIYNKIYTNIFNIKLNNIHKLAEEFEKGVVYLEKLTMSNRSKWLKKHFKNEIKMFASTYKEVVVKSYFDLRDKNTPVKYDIIFNFNGTDPNNQQKFDEINRLTRQLVTEEEVMEALQYFINATGSADIKVISKAQLLDLIEEAIDKKKIIDEEFLGNWELGNNIDVEVYKNPASIKNFEDNVRAISDHDGNLYVPDKVGNFIHGNLYRWLARNEFISWYDHDDDREPYGLMYDAKYVIFWEREGTTNKFRIGESYSLCMFEDKKIVKTIISLTEKVKQRNPQYEFNISII